MQVVNDDKNAGEAATRPVGDRNLSIYTRLCATRRFRDEIVGVCVCVPYCVCPAKEIIMHKMVFGNPQIAAYSDNETETQ